MTNQTIATALTLGFLAFILSTLLVTTLGAQPAQSQAQANCQARGANYRYDPQYGCMKVIQKRKPTSGGAGGGSDDCGPGYFLDPASGCVKCPGYMSGRTCLPFF